MADREGVQFFGRVAVSSLLSSRSGEARRGTRRALGACSLGVASLQLGGLRRLKRLACKAARHAIQAWLRPARWLIRFLANCAIRSAMLSNGWLTPVSFSIEVIVTFAIPQGVIASKGERSPPTLRAKPCIVIQCRTPTPIEAILRLALSFRASNPHTRQAGARHRLDLALREQLNEQRFDPAQIAM